MAPYGDRDLDGALERYAALKANQADLYDLSEGDLNDFGYSLLREKHVDEATRVFQHSGRWFYTSRGSRFAAKHSDAFFPATR